jgi:hypothetical protein
MSIETMNVSAGAGHGKRKIRRRLINVATVMKTTEAPSTTNVPTREHARTLKSLEGMLHMLTFQQLEVLHRMASLLVPATPQQEVPPPSSLSEELSLEVVKPPTPWELLQQRTKSSSSKPSAPVVTPVSAVPNRKARRQSYNEAIQMHYRSRSGFYSQDSIADYLVKRPPVSYKLWSTMNPLTRVISLVAYRAAASEPALPRPTPYVAPPKSSGWIGPPPEFPSKEERSWKAHEKALKQEQKRKEAREWALSRQ